MTKILNKVLNEDGLDFNLSKQGITPLSLCVSIFIKYGMLGLICVYFGYNIREKDSELKLQSQAIVRLVETQTAAMTRNTEVMAGLSKVIETNTSKLEEIRRAR